MVCVCSEDVDASNDEKTPLIIIPSNDDNDDNTSYGFLDNLRSLSVEEENICCYLTYQDRLIACVICFLMGWLCDALSTMTLIELATKPEKFAALYTLGRILLKHRL